MFSMLSFGCARHLSILVISFYCLIVYPRSKGNLQIQKLSPKHWHYAHIQQKDTPLKFLGDLLFPITNGFISVVHVILQVNRTVILFLTFFPAEAESFVNIMQ